MTLQGFKSFCDRTQIVFGTGITAIVGPNGCGKSNLADALRWVLGEHNARFLRCNRLEDLIFSGTKSRKAMGMAEVKLLLEGVLDDGELEIVRRFTRDGSSDYLMNNKMCRLKDIYESLLGTGLSHTGYVVIGQGTIQELAGGKPEDRRAWIEEVSGVSRFKLNRKEVESKLAQASRDIVRLKDLLAELEQRKKTLYLDWQTAVRYQKLVDKKNRLELAMWLHQEKEQSKRLLNVTHRRNNNIKEMDEIAATITILEDENEPTKNQLVSLERMIKDKLAQRENTASKLVTLEKNKDSVKGKISLVSREIKAKTVRQDILKREMAEMYKKKAEAEKNVGSVTKLLDENLRSLKRAEEKRQIFESQWRQLSEKIISIKESMVVYTARLNQLQQTKFNLKEQAKSRNQKIEEIQRYLLSLDKKILQYTQQLEETTKQFHRKKEEQEQYEFTWKVAEKQLEDAKGHREKLVSLYSNLQSRSASLNSRKRLLEEMEDTYEGYSKGPRAVLKAKKQLELKGIIGSVGDLFSCQAKYVSALSSAVGGAAQNIVVINEDAAKDAINFLKKRKYGRCTFLPVNLLKPGKLHTKVEQVISNMEGVRPLISVIDYPKDLKPCAEYLLGRVVLAETIELALNFMHRSSWAIKVVTLEGESLQPGGAITGGQAHRYESIFMRKHEIASLKLGIKNLTQQLNDTKSGIESTNIEISEISKRAYDAKEKAFVARTSVAGLEEKIEHLKSELKIHRAEIARVKEEIQPIIIDEKGFLVEIAETSTLEQNISVQLREKETELKEFEDMLHNKTEADGQYLDDLKKINSKHQELQKEMGFFVRHLENLKGEIGSAHKTINEEEGELARLKTLKNELLQEDTNIENIITNLKKEIGVVSGHISEGQDRLKLLKQSLERNVERIKSLNLKQNTLKSWLNDAEYKIKEYEAVLSDTRNMIKSRYGIASPDTYIHPRISRQEALPQIENVETAIQNLGTVNLKAEKDYEELSKRIEQIHNEKTDVEHAINELKRALKIIQKEIAIGFTNTFEAVNQNFQRIFRELFGGGRGNLSLVEDTLGVEVIAEPPGRRHEQFNLLSGGERSLCGIALIFAILATNPSPVMVLDEVDSSLDEANVVRFAQFLKRYSQDTQFIVITHQESTMEAADIIYGVTMEEPGVSKIFSMRLESD